MVRVSPRRLYHVRRDMPSDSQGVRSYSSSVPFRRASPERLPLDEAEILLCLTARKVLAADPANRLHDVMDLAGVQLHVEGRGTCLSWRLGVKKHALTKNPDLILIQEVFTGFLS